MHYLTALRKWAAIIRWSLIACAAGVSTGSASAQPSPSCQALYELRGRAGDVGPVLQQCIEQIPIGGELALAPGRYHLMTPIRITQSLRLTTAELDRGASPCRSIEDVRCAAIVVDMRVESAKPGRPKQIPPIEVAADNVTIDHLVISGVRGRDLANDRALCRNPVLRPLGGGLRISGKGFALLGSVLVNFTCYTAVEVTRHAGITAKDNLIAFNGNSLQGMRADGMTVADAVGAEIIGNTFIDNTDVQMIFGGCRDCIVRDNLLLHTDNPAGGSFAVLMLHAWPSTSGQYQGSVITVNTIDCGPKKHCGFGLMIGPDPWYKAPTAGGTVSHNIIRNAMLGLNIDNLSGPMTVRDNRVLDSGGRFVSSCGIRDAPAVNIAPTSRRFVDVTAIEKSAGTASSADEYAGCILNHPPHSTAPR